MTLNVLADVLAPDFKVVLSPTNAQVPVGETATCLVRTSVLNGSRRAVSLWILTLPSGMTASFNPATVVAGNTPTLRISSTAPTRHASFAVHGTAGTLVHSASGTIDAIPDLAMQPLAKDVSLFGIRSSPSRPQQMFVIRVPERATTLTVQLCGETGDADLYLRAGQQPTLTAVTCRPFLNGSNETCTIKALQRPARISSWSTASACSTVSR